MVGSVLRPDGGCQPWREAALGHIEKRSRVGRSGSRTVTYRARWREASGRERVRTFDRKLDAQRFLVSVEDAKLRGAYVDPAAGRAAFGPWAERWYATTAALKPTTRRDYRSLLDNHVLPWFAEWPLAGIDTLAVREFKAAMVARGLGGKRAGKALQVLSLVLASAVEGGRLAANRAAGVRPPKVQRREMLFLDAGEVEALAAAIDPRWRALVLVAAYSGLRPCELVALKVGRLDLLHREVRVVQAAPEVAGRLCWGTVKTHEARTVRLPRSVAEELAAHLARQDHGPDDLVFTAARGGPIRASKWVPTYFKPAVRAAGLPEALHWYDLRHTCASWLIAERGSIKAVQKHMGHATAAITLDVYGHLFPNELPGAGRAARGAPRTRSDEPVDTHRRDLSATQRPPDRGVRDRTLRSAGCKTRAGGGVRTLTPRGARRF
jgi:integrase